MEEQMETTKTLWDYIGTAIRVHSLLHSLLTRLKRVKIHLNLSIKIGLQLRAWDIGCSPLK